MRLTETAKMRSFVNLMRYPMTVISLIIPDELEPALQKVPGSVEAFILEAIRRELTPQQWASDAELEAATAADNDDDFLSRQDLQYYLSLSDA